MPVPKFSHPVLRASVVFALILNSFLAIAQDAGKVITVVGKVNFKVSDSAPMQPLTVGKVLQVGWSIKTEADGKAKLLLTDRTVIDLTPTTEFKVDQFKQNGTDTLNREVALAVKFGKIRSSVNSPVSDKGKFLIKTKSTTMGVRGTEFIVNSMISNSGDKGVQNVNTQITVIHGKVAVSDLSNPNAQPVMLTTGKQLVSEVRINIATGGFVAPPGNSPASAGPKVVDVPKQELDQMKSETTVQDTTFKDSTSIEEKSKSEREAKKEEAEKKEADKAKDSKDSKDTKEAKEDGKETKEGKGSTDQAQTSDKDTKEKDKDKTADKGKSDGGEKSDQASNKDGKDSKDSKDKAGDGKGGREPASDGSGTGDKNSAKNDGGKSDNGSGSKSSDKTGPMSSMPPSSGSPDLMSGVANALGGSGNASAGGPLTLTISGPPPKAQTSGTGQVNSASTFQPVVVPATVINNGAVNVKVTFSP